MINLNIDDFSCLCFPAEGSGKVAYLLYPSMAQIPEKDMEKFKKEFGISIVFVSIPSGKWDDLMTPWPEKGENHSSTSFKGNADKMLSFLQSRIIPEVEKSVGIMSQPVRSLIGVSLSGMFALWQWLKCDTFQSIASLSGSFWYEGFIDWIENSPIPSKTGKAFFLLGRKEPEAHAFKTVGENTELIIDILKKHQIETIFEWVDGNHFTDPTGRLEKALESLFN